ncbi:MAG: hypothetical protein Q8T09_11460 [Candidatus Melainabacteria bacterium]|nr:hypothetical protein [Candidatus Melainabacteria bacterium]
MSTIFTVSYVVSGGILAAALARFGATLAITWTGGNDKDLPQARKYASGLALVGGGLAACSPVNPLFAVVLAASVGLFTAFCLGLLYFGAKVPKHYGNLLKFVDGKAGKLNSELAKPETKQALLATVSAVTEYAKVQASNLIPNKNDEVTGDGSSVTSDSDNGAGDGGSNTTVKSTRPNPRKPIA